MHPPVNSTFSLPSASDEASSPTRWLTIETEVQIAADCATVHACATNAARWVEWHPATHSVTDVPNRPLGLGETIVERIHAGGRRFTAIWTVLAVEAPNLWVISTDSAEGRARILYRLTEGRAPDGSVCTQFHRSLSFCSKSRLLRWLDPWIARWVLVPQSRRALDNLRRLLEVAR